MAVSEDYLAHYEPTDELVRQAMDAGADISVGEGSWVDGPDGKMFRCPATLTRPDGRQIRIEGWAQQGDAQTPDIPGRESPFQIIGRAQIRARRAVARVFLEKAPELGEGQTDWQKRLQIQLRDVGGVTGLGREAVAREVCAMFGVDSTTELTQGQAEQAMRGLTERLSAARRVQ